MDWQPARLNHSVHRQQFAERYGHRLIPDSTYAYYHQTVVRIRETQNAGEECIREYRNAGCDSSRFFEIHPDDLIQPSGDIVCIHEVLTD